jgi:hypothetical protein
MNTKFFHIVANSRRRKNLILSLQINDTISFNITDITSHILGYFKNLLGTEETRMESLDNYIWEENEKLSQESRLALELSITLEEIKIAVFDCNGNKAPGPDGIPFLFYQQYWTLVSKDIFNLVQAFYNNRLDLTKLKHACIVLIPKLAEANEIK